MELYNKNKNSSAIDESVLNFLSNHYQRINIARLKHLDSLKLNIENKKVIDLGAGIGDHSLFYLLKNCSVLPIEGRKDLVDFINYRFDINAKCVNLENELDKLNEFSGFDFVHCYGLLYHLNNPEEFLKTASKIGNTLLLETMVSGASEDTVNLIPEDKMNSTQAISGVGCRPNREWLFNTLKKLFKFVYVPYTQPDHEQFPMDWTQIAEKTTHTRIVFICSHDPINSPILTEELIVKHS